MKLGTASVPRAMVGGAAARLCGPALRDGTFFCGIAFTIDLVVNMYGGLPMRSCRLGWNILDFVAITIGLLFLMLQIIDDDGTVATIRSRKDAQAAYEDFAEYTNAWIELTGKGDFGLIVIIGLLFLMLHVIDDDGAMEVVTIRSRKDAQAAYVDFAEGTNALIELTGKGGSVLIVITGLLFLMLRIIDDAGSMEVVTLRVGKDTKAAYVSFAEETNALIEVTSKYCEDTV